ncbi:D-2-hydroxyacid dehydrogenase family protein [Paraburkholderia sp. Ac-20340]|uniref:D-2-hydroxyacid dehydrogenase family protein n=1 Tax=Paraburkholderia sp. Ac-20340 TaxID=2703888 RepID=UPI00197DBB32|nr:D-2-hydroxyacid dehydrogenase family protein [Paraburkholderia sp. Ac-20340]MBN3857535.1 D-2-hydroxyacid dehydrogenase family protein [Paraburkholderia sp. Ac-20340]
MTTRVPFKVAVLDDYQQVSHSMADWSPLKGYVDITVFDDHLADPDAVAARLFPFDVVCVMRERTPLPRHILARLPNLKLIVSTGAGNASIDEAAAAAFGIEVCHTRYWSTPTIEFTWALILSMARNLPREHQSLRDGGWQVSVGDEIAGKTLGLLGLGRVGSAVARIGQAFGMNVMAWSQNLTVQTAAEHDVKYVTRDALFEHSDFLSIHVRLSPRTQHLVGVPELARMKSTSRLINTSRGPIVDATALVHALESGAIAGAALDVYDIEPPPAQHPLRTLPNVLATPHIGYVSNELYRTFYSDTVQHIGNWLERSRP